MLRSGVRTLDGALQDRRYIQDQRHVTGTQDARSAHAVHLRKHLRQGLDYGLELTQQGVYDYSCALAAVANHYDALALRGGNRASKQGAQVNERQHFAAQAGEIVSVRGGEFDTLVDGVERQDE